MSMSMSTVRKTILTILSITVLLTLPIMTKAQSPMQNDDDELALEIDQMLTSVFNADDPGAAVIVLRDGQEILRKGYGMANLELAVAIEPEMVFRLGSVTKQFTAMAILMLSEEGKLALDDDITLYLPDYPTQGQTLTIEQLLTHTGGVKDFEFLPSRLAVSRTDLTVEELVALFQDEPLDFTPGDGWSYSSSGYVLLGAIIETVSGMPYAEFIQERIFTPLGMEHSFYDDAMSIIPGRVPGYTRTATAYVNAEYMSLTHPYAAGSLASSVDDLGLWDAALYTDELVNQSTLQPGFRQAVLNNGLATGYGYGWEVGEYEGHAIIAHNGGINGFSTQVMRLPDDKVYVAILSNDENQQSLGDVAFQIASLAIGHPYQDPKALTLPSSTLSRYEGMYQLTEQIRLVIRRDADQLFMHVGSQQIALEPMSYNEFFIASVPVRIKFVRKASGPVTALQFQRNFGTLAYAAKSDLPLPVASTVTQVDPALYDPYVGDYQIAPGLSIQVSTVDGKLYAQATGEASVELLPESEIRFFLAGADVQIEFTRDGEGEVTGLILYQSGQEIAGQKVK